jgi:hypothetical protein
MRKLILALAAVSVPASAQELGISDAPAAASAEDPGTNLTWELELAPAFGDNPKVGGFKALEDNALSGSLSIRHNFPSRTYLMGTLSAEANPKFAAPRVEGAEVGGELRLGQKILLGGSGDAEGNRDSLDFHAIAKLSHGTEEVEDIRRSYTDREVGVQATLTNILWLYSDRRTQADRSKWRAGPNYELTAAWSTTDSDKQDRDNRALTATGALGYEMKGGVGLKASLEYENIRYRNVFTSGDRRRDNTLTGYAGVDLGGVLPEAWGFLEKFEIGAEVTNTDSNDDAEDDTAVYLRLKIGFGRTHRLGR